MAAAHIYQRVSVLDIETMLIFLFAILIYLVTFRHDKTLSLNRINALILPYLTYLIFNSLSTHIDTEVVSILHIIPNNFNTLFCGQTIIKCVLMFDHIYLNFLSSNLIIFGNILTFCDFLSGYLESLWEGFNYFYFVDVDAVDLSLILPVVLYTNADTQKVQILEENRGKSGIYQWKNNVNKKSYVGSSVNLGQRFSCYYNYKFISNPRFKMLIYKAILKYDYSNFTLEILEYCEPEKCIEREQYYIDLLQPEYNFLKTAGSLLGYKHTKETLAKLSAANVGEFNPNFGKTHSEEARAKISAANLNKINTNEIRKKMAAAKQGEKNPMSGKTHSEESRKKWQQPIYIKEYPY